VPFEGYVAARLSALLRYAGHPERNYGPASGSPVTVHGHPGTLSRTGSAFLLNVPGWIRTFSSGADLIDAEILAIARHCGA
jgi:hypothetical protein